MLAATDMDLDRENREFWENFRQDSCTFLTRDPSKSYFMEPVMEKAEEVFKKVATRPLFILEIGCGDGWDTARLAARGHKVHAVDVAFNRLDRAVDNLEKLKVAEGVQFSQCRAEALPFPNDTFDLVYSNSVLLYAGGSKVVGEAHRVLKPGGTALFSNESLPHHPLVKLARRTTGGSVKREMERLVNRIEPDKIKREFGDLFSKVDHHEFLLISPFSLAVRQLMKKVKLIAEDPTEMSYRWTHALDKVALDLVPPLRKFCWVTVMECTK